MALGLVHGRFGLTDQISGIVFLIAGAQYRNADAGRKTQHRPGDQQRAVECFEQGLSERGSQGGCRGAGDDNGKGVTTVVEVLRSGLVFLVSKTLRDISQDLVTDGRIQ